MLAAVAAHIVAKNEARNRVAAYRKTTIPARPQDQAALDALFNIIEPTLVLLLCEPPGTPDHAKYSRMVDEMMACVNQYAPNAKGASPTVDGDAKRREAKRSLDAFMALVETPPTPLAKEQQQAHYNIVEEALLQVCTMAANDPRRPGLESVWQGALTEICRADVAEKVRLGKGWVDPSGVFKPFGATGHGGVRQPRQASHVDEWVSQVRQPQPRQAPCDRELVVYKGDAQAPLPKGRSSRRRGRICRAG